MQILIDIPDNIKDRVIDAFANNYNYMAILADGTPNPQNKNQFVKQQVINFLKENVRAYESQQASETARQTAISLAETDINLS